MKRIITLLYILCCILVSNASTVQKITLKNGSVLNGFIQRQDGTGNMTVKTENAIICVKNTRLYISPDRQINKSNLSDAWKKWAEKNDAFVNNGSEDNLRLSDVKFEVWKQDSVARKGLSHFEINMHDTQKSFADVYVLEKGTNIRFLEMTSNVYTVSWDDIVTITSERRAKNALSGVDRKYTLKLNREVSGQYAGETKNTISLYQTNGVVETVDYDDIVKFSYYGINPQQDIFAQSELLDVVTVKNGSPVRGVIIEQNYSSNKDSENYISVWVKGRSPQMIKISDIEAISKEENTEYYSPKFDIILKEGQIVVNRKDVKYVNVKENKDVLVLDSLHKQQIIAQEKDNKTRIIVEMRQSGTNVIETLQLIKVNKLTNKKNNIYGFSYKDLVNNNLRPLSDETSINKTRKIEFAVQSAGVYALYDAKNKRAIPLIVK